MIHQPIPLSAARALALHTQLLDAPASQPPTIDSIYNVVESLGCVQIDTLQMVARSQYLVIWSRLGSYNPADFDRLIFSPDDRRLFEYWRHAMSIIPLKFYRYQMPHMTTFRNNDGSKWYEKWLNEDGSHREVLGQVLDRIRDEGPLRAADFEYDGPRRDSWWDWKPAKRALEYHFTAGNLMITDRVNFQRVYDLAERVLPDWVDTNEAAAEAADRHHVEQAVRSLGICRPLQAAEYAYMKRTPVRQIIKELIEDGTITTVQGVLSDGEAHELIVHRDNLKLLEQAADGALIPERTTFLSPFDSLFWARGRDEDFWHFRQALEAYKPAKDRIWGYFCLPTLHRDRLVGRFDPKLDRKSGTLYLRALYLEPDIYPDEELVTDVAGAMRDFLKFHEATDLVIEKSDPVDFGDKLRASL